MCFLPNTKVKNKDNHNKIAMDLGALPTGQAVLLAFRERTSFSLEGLPEVCHQHPQFTGAEAEVQGCAELMCWGGSQ